MLATKFRAMCEDYVVDQIASLAATIILVAWTSYSQTYPSSPLPTVVLSSSIAVSLMWNLEPGCKNQ